MHRLTCIFQYFILFNLLFLLQTAALAEEDTAWKQLIILPDPLPIQFTDDGNGLLHGLPVKAVINDPNPVPQSLRHIPVPDTFQAAPEYATASFSISYVPSGSTDEYGESCTTFPANAKSAFQYAASIWANTLKSSVPITIKACWANLGSASILGYSGTGTYRRNFQGSVYANTWHAASLANALAGSDLDPGVFDMHTTYNTNFNWYFGTDGNTPSYQHDFVTVVLHEIAHGLNFSGLTQYSSVTEQGSWGYNTGSPSIYDLFIRDGSGNTLINTSIYPNPSYSLGSALRSGNIWFYGSKAMAANGGSRVKIYAPSTWQSGSSYSHLDYATFNNTQNQLMVYAISAGESIHDSGPITRGLLKDLGWTQGTVTNPVPPAIPSSVSASDGQCLNRIFVEWSPSLNASSYTLYRCSNTSTSSCSPLADLEKTRFTDMGMATDTTFYYRVQANNDHGSSSFSHYNTGFRSLSAPTCAAIAPALLLLIN